MYHNSIFLLMFFGFWAGFMDSIVGGGGLISLPSILAIGLNPVEAIATNKIIGVTSAIPSSYHYFKKNTIQLEMLGWILLIAFSGSFIGSFVTTRMSPLFLKWFIFSALLIVAVYSLTRRNFGEIQAEPKTYRKPVMMVLSFVLGFYDGFFGPGAGTFMILTFLSLFGYHLLHAASTARCMNLATNLGSIVLFASMGLIHYQLALPGAVCSFIGGVLGSRYSTRFGSKGIRPIFFISVFLLLLKLAFDLVKNLG